MSIKRNFFYNFILTVSNYIFPLFTYPYVSRVLGVNNIGICNFVDSIVNYFILFSMMGFTTIGIREIAKCKNDRKQLNEIFSSIITLNIIFTIIAIIALVTLTFSLKALMPYKELLFYGCFKLLFNVFLIEWFFQGIENFKYITIRSIIIKTLYVISIFVFVNQIDDYNLFYLLSVLMIVINSIINWQYRKKYVTFSFKNISIYSLIKSTLTLGLYRFLTSMYTTFNVAYLGFVSTTTQVGYYTTAVKFHSMLIAVFSAFTSVMLPRMSDLIANNNIDEFKMYTNKSFEILYTLAFPIILGVIILSPEIIYLFSGSGFEGAILPLRIIIPLILVIGLEQILIVQILIPMKKDNAILINSIIGAFLGLSLNLLLVDKYLSVGTSIVWLLSEFFVFLSAYYFVNKYIKLSIDYKLIMKNILLSLPIVIISYTMKMVFENFLIILFTSFLISFIYFLLIQIYIQKNHFILNSLISIKRIFHEK